MRTIWYTKRAHSVVPQKQLISFSEGRGRGELPNAKSYILTRIHESKGATGKGVHRWRIGHRAKSKSHILKNIKMLYRLANFFFLKTNKFLFVTCQSKATGNSQYFSGWTLYATKNSQNDLWMLLLLLAGLGLLLTKNRWVRKEPNATDDRRMNGYLRTNWRRYETITFLMLSKNNT